MTDIVDMIYEHNAPYRMINEMRQISQDLHDSKIEIERLRARVAELEHALRLSRVVVFGDSKTMGLLDTTDGYYGWSDSPEVVLLREYVDTLIAKRPDGDSGQFEKAEANR